MSNLTEMTPHELSDELIRMAQDYSKAGEIRIRLIRNHALFYQSFRDDHKSDASLERAWELTDDGLNLLEISQKLKNIEKKMSAIKSLLRTREGEARNHY